MMNDDGSRSQRRAEQLRRRMGEDLRTLLDDTVRAPLTDRLVELVLELRRREREARTSG